MSFDTLGLAGLDLAQPFGLAALLTLLPMALAWRYAAGRRRAADEAYGGPQQLRAGTSRGWHRAAIWLSIGAVVLLAFAVARPRWGESSTDLQRRGIDIAIVLDISRSMRATDVAPSRAEAASVGLESLLSNLRGDRVSLTTFAGSAFERSPLTLDLDAVVQLIAGAQNEEALVRPGSDLGLAIEQGLASLSVDDPAATQILLLVSDGEDLRDRLDVALDTASDHGIPIYTVPVGTSNGATLTDGQTSIADRDTLAAVSERTGGELRELETVVGLAVDFRRLALTVFEESPEHGSAERFQWFIAAALALLVARTLLPEAGSRRPLSIARLPVNARGRLGGARGGLVAGGLLAVLLITGCAGTSAFEHVETGNEAFAARDYDTAQVEYARAAEIDPANAAILYNRANALHELRRFEEAQLVYAEALAVVEDSELSARIRYGAANTAVRREALDEARLGYIAVLHERPDDVEAKANLELVLTRLRPDPPSDDPDDTQGPGPGEQPSDGATQPGGTGDPGGEPGDGSPGETPSGGSPGGTPTAGDPTTDGGSGQPAPPQTLEEALAALEALEAALGDDITVEQALLLLDLAAQANALRALEGSASGGPVAR